MTPGWRLAIGTAALIASVVTGVGLGNYVSAHDSNRSVAGQESLSIALPPPADQAAAPNPAQPALSPEGPVICKGCGPTLAERKQAEEEARYGALGYGMRDSDPVVRRYLKDAAEEEARWNRRDAARLANSPPIAVTRTLTSSAVAQPAAARLSDGAIGAGAPN